MVYEASILDNLNQFLMYTGFANVTLAHIVMILVGLVFIYLAITKDWEPMLLIPIGFGILIGNIPLFPGLNVGVYEQGSVLNIFYGGVQQGWYPPLIFLGIGAMTDFSALISNPKLMLIGAAAQFGIFFTLCMASMFFPDFRDFFSIAIIGAADGPTSIAVANKLGSQYVGAITVAAYSYMALVPIIQPPIIKAITTKKERCIRMEYTPGNVSKATRIIFPIAVTIIAGAVVAVKDIFGVVFNLVISIVFAFYCLACKETLARQGRRLAYALLKEKVADKIVRIMRMTNSAFSNFLTGQCLEALILGLMFVPAMAIFKMPYIPLICVLITITALVPLVGAFVGCAFGAFFILVNDPMQAVTFVIMFLVIQQIEGNLIYPRVVGNSIGLPGMWVLLAVAVGGDLMGVGGMLLMIPLASVLYALTREFTQKRLADRDIPAEKLQYHPLDVTSKFREKREKNKENGLLVKLKKKKK